MRRRSERADPVAVKQHTLLSSVAVEHRQPLLGALAILDTQTRAPLRPCADALERSLLIVDFSECDGSGNLPRSIHIDPADPAALLEATRSLCSTDGDVVTLPATELPTR